jgi:hypothetical protein
VSTPPRILEGKPWTRYSTRYSSSLLVTPVAVEPAPDRAPLARGGFVRSGSAEGFQASLADDPAAQIDLLSQAIRDSGAAIREVAQSSYRRFDGFRAAPLLVRFAALAVFFRFFFAALFFGLTRSGNSAPGLPVPLLELFGSDLAPH